MTSKNSESAAHGSVRLSGRVVSRGTASGTVFILPNHTRFTEIRDVPDSEIENEISKFDSAVISVANDLHTSLNDGWETVSDDARAIIDAQIAIIRDRSFSDKVHGRISSDRLGAQLAIRVVSDEFTDQLRSLNDEHLREKAADIQDVCDRLITALAVEVPLFDVPIGSVIVCSEVWPSTVLKLAEFKPAAIISESGGWTSHAFILARELGIAAISGIKNVHQRLSNGDRVIVDAINGFIELDDSDDDKNATVLVQNLRSEISISSDVTLADGTTIQFIANVDSAEKCRQTIDRGVNEIGLVRSEYLFDLHGRLPDESIQDKMYAEIALATKGRRVAIRTFDVSIGRLGSGGTRRERNPALGMRSIRLSLRYERQFRAQLRSLIRANFGDNLSIVVPMVSGASDVLRVRSILLREYETLVLSDPNTKIPSVGAMIELPSAVLTIDQIIEVTDFVCIGTNDLVQYTLGVDRDNESVADWYQTLHPAILRSLKSIVEAAAKEGKPATICGEAAGSPFYLPLLVGLGFQRFSMNPFSIPSMINYAAMISIEDCADLAERMLRSTLTSKNERLLTEFCSFIWPELEGERVNFPPKSF
ncbi:MAG: phosphoenolpyruvate--protein phosphotransferase [Blastocatellia bacterium]|nr:phosphoenolpyruvate--protein phosphotransferase [Blastocatellia bacterium]